MEFLNKYKRILGAIGLLLVSALIGYFIYALFFNPPSGPTTPKQATTTPGGGLPTARPGQPGATTTAPATGAENLPVSPEIPSPVANGGLTEVKEVSNKNTLDAALSSNGSDVQYYDQTDGKFYRLDKDGNVTTLSDKIFHDVQT
ncbi:MAG: hypothetical protein NTW06_00855, partial [Candidatus Falkowbacteria bacterium]|nr:hypothetical protein [Candidatus Falkowbacteria bacterium]